MRVIQERLEVGRFTGGRRLAEQFRVDYDLKWSPWASESPKFTGPHPPPHRVHRAPEAGSGTGAIPSARTHRPAR